MSPPGPPTPPPPCQGRSGARSPPPAAGTAFHQTAALPAKQCARVRRAANAICRVQRDCTYVSTRLSNTRPITCLNTCVNACATEPVCPVAARGTYTCVHECITIPGHYNIAYRCHKCSCAFSFVCMHALARASARACAFACACVHVYICAQRRVGSKELSNISAITT